MSSTVIKAISNSENDPDWLTNLISLRQDKHEVLTNPLDSVPPVLQHIEGINKLKLQIDRELAIPAGSRLPLLFSMVKCIWPKGSLEVAGLPWDNGYNDVIPKRPSGVFQRFPFTGGDALQVQMGIWKQKHELVVDIVSWNGDKWYKVSSSSPKRIAKEAKQEMNITRTILDHAMEYTDCAEENPYPKYDAPEVGFIFTRGVSIKVAEELEDMGVEVIGRRLTDRELEGGSKKKSEDPQVGKGSVANASEDATAIPDAEEFMQVCNIG